MTDVKTRGGDGTAAPPQPLEERHLRYFHHRDPADRDWLVDRYQGLARSLAIRAAGPQDDLDDVVQVAFIGLLGALERFDPTRGFAFSTFAWSTISGELKRHQRDHTWDVRVPRSVQECYLRVGAATEDLVARLRRPPTIAELAAYCADDEALVVQALEAQHARSVRSLDAPVHADGTPVDVGVTDAEADALDDRDLLRALLQRLPERDRRIVVLRFFDDRSQSEIADEVRCSQMQVSRVLSHALDRLRAMAELELAGFPRRSVHHAAGRQALQGKVAVSASRRPAPRSSAANASVSSNQQRAS